MVFKKRSAPQGRTRPIPAPRQGRSGEVFSYHAKRSVRTPHTARNAGIPGAASAGAVTRKKDPALRRRRLYSFGGLAVILLLIGFMLQLDAKPRVVTVDLGTEKQLFLRDHAVYEEAAARIFRQSVFNRSKLTVNTNAIVDQMQQQFPELVAVSVSLPVTGSRPTMHIQPAQPHIVLSTSTSGTYLLDASGRALMEAAQAPSLADLTAPVVIDESGITIKEGQLALPRATIAFIAEVAGQLQAQKIEATSYTLTPGANELHIRLQGVGYYVKFNVRGNAREEVGAYLAVKKKLESEKKMPAEYVDVRVENRAYFR